MPFVIINDLLINLIWQSNSMKENQAAITPVEELLQLLLYKIESKEGDYLCYTEKEKTYTVLTLMNCLERQSYLRTNKDPFSFYRVKDI